MAISSSAAVHSGADDAQIWASLKDAIATSSGFQRWRREQVPQILQDPSLDKLVRRYLRETLETLAY
ncbi:hypothetical protein [Leptolyngbya sp. PCC 6406]|uniref:hypothetical protein n=1 Tax=Leptolyngbya sp. PCC 6406 TaxID=1173264 RepID=UPI0002ABA3C7|nr:hypothetical protein [Leptolyngbya sp. PCC 6406]